MKKTFALLLTLLSSSSLLKAGDFKPLEADAEAIKGKIGRLQSKIESGKLSPEDRVLTGARINYLQALREAKLEEQTPKIERAAKDYLDAKFLENLINQGELPSLYHNRKTLGDLRKDEVIVNIIMMDRNFQFWGQLAPDLKELAVAMVKSRSESLSERKTLDDVTGQKRFMDAYRFYLTQDKNAAQSVEFIIKSTGVIIWDKLSASEQDQAVTMFRLKNVIDEQRIVDAFRFYQNQGGQSPEQIVENIMTGNFDSWAQLSAVDKEWAGQKLRSSVARSDLSELIKQPRILQDFIAQKQKGNPFPNELIDKIMGHNYPFWTSLLATDKDWAETELRSSVARLELGELIRQPRIIEAFRFYQQQGKQSLSELVENIVGSNYLPDWATLSSVDKEWAKNELISRPEVQDLRESFEKRMAPQSTMKLDQQLFGGVAVGDTKILLSNDPLPYNERSELYRPFGADLPTIPIIHSYKPDFPPSSHFSAVFSEKEVSVPNSLKPFIGNSKREKIFFFNVQSVEPEVEAGSHYSLKPQYSIFPYAPAIGENSEADDNLVSTIQWTVVPGSEGKVIPVAQGGQQLLDDVVSAHHPGEDRLMVLSGDTMHLQGIDPMKSVDLYSLVNADNRTFVTYHWALDRHDYDTFLSVLQKSRTLSEIIEGLKQENTFNHLLGELQQYVGYYGR